LFEKLDGCVEVINKSEKEDREIFPGMWDGAITSLFALKSNNPNTNTIK